jgi:hypothetical protein
MKNESIQSSLPRAKCQKSEKDVKDSKGPSICARIWHPDGSVVVQADLT